MDTLSSLRSKNLELSWREVWKTLQNNFSDESGFGSDIMSDNVFNFWKKARALVLISQFSGRNLKEFKELPQLLRLLFLAWYDGGNRWIECYYSVLYLSKILPEGYHISIH